MSFEKEEIRFENLIKKRVNPKLSIQEYLVDLLGGLFPGILFILAFSFSLFPPLFTITSYVNKSKNSISDFINSFFTSIQNTPSAIWIVAFLLFLLLSYIVGHIFYRSDPKTPDKKGFSRLHKTMRKKLICEISKAMRKNIKFWGLRQLVSLCHKLYISCKFSSNVNYNKKLRNRLKQNYGCTSKDDCEFPYPYYSDYLKKRGLTHLISLAIWSNGKNFKRSKTFINILKIRLKYYFPDKYGTITRNEAHVRLASSAWYVSSISLYIGILGFLISVFFCYKIGGGKLNSNIFMILSEHLTCVISPLFIALSSGYLKHNISKFIHYQRLREVFYVLETAFTAFRLEQNKQIIDPPFKL